MLDFAPKPTKWAVARAAGTICSSGLETARAQPATQTPARHTAAMIPPVNSLVKFDNPVLVSSAGGKKGLAPAAKPQLTQTDAGSEGGGR